MLYNTDWDKTKTDPLSLDSLIAWLEKRSADEKYCYTDSGRCLLSQYFSDMGFSGVRMISRNFLHEDGNVRLPNDFNYIAIGPTYEILTPKWSFGDALKRAKAIRAARK